VTLAALIAAYHDADGPDGALRATLPLAGRTVVERQARLAAASGADPIILLVERVPPALLAAIDRVRAEGISVAVARNAAEAAEAVDPKAQLLLIADGLVADESHIERLAAAGGAAILTLPDHGEDDRYERIDAESLWAGLALIEGRMLRDTAAMLGDWDLQSTLLRRAVQAGARQLAIRGEAADDRLTIAESAADLAEAEAVIVASASAPRGSWISRYPAGAAGIFSHPAADVDLGDSCLALHCGGDHARLGRPLVRQGLARSRSHHPAAFDASRRGGRAPVDA
jgi:hypothetical protein